MTHTKNIDIKLNDFALPIEIKTDSEYYDDLSNVFGKYKKHIASVQEIDAHSREKIDENCKNILKSIEKYYDAQFSEAEKCIYDILQSYTNSPFIVASMNESYAFKGMAPKFIRSDIYKNAYKNEYDMMLSDEIVLYRARVSNEDLTRSDMLHIPFNKREIITTQRFSMPGIPCLYLATTSLGAWIEMGMPDVSNFHVSAFSIPGDIKVLNLCQNQYFINGSASCVDAKLEHKYLHDFLEIFPMVIASSYKVLANNRSFKSEYIIPQLIMQAARKLNIDGVAYLSKRMEDFYAYPQCVNLAILIPYKGDNKSNYWKRTEEILLTKPFTIHDIAKDFQKKNTAYVNKYYSDGVPNQIMLAENVMNYSEMVFSKFDEYLFENERKTYKE